MWKDKTKRPYKFDDLPTNFDVLKRWKDNDGKVLQKGNYGDDEDKVLLTAVYKVHKDRSWQLEEGIIAKNRKKLFKSGAWDEVANYLPHRNRTSLCLRATRLIHPGNDLLQWTSEEESTLKSLYEKRGCKWVEFQGVTGKWSRRIERKSIKIVTGGKVTKSKKRKWNDEENEKFCFLLREKIAQMQANNLIIELRPEKISQNFDWDEISKKLGTRTHYACSNKWVSRFRPNGSWFLSDDNRLLKAMMDSNAKVEEEVLWEDLLPEKSEIDCNKRWNQMKLFFPEELLSFDICLEIACDVFAPEGLEDTIIEEWRGR